MALQGERVRDAHGGCRGREKERKEKVVSPEMLFGKKNAKSICMRILRLVILPWSGWVRDFSVYLVLICWEQVGVLTPLLWEGGFSLLAHHTVRRHQVWLDVG